MNLHPSLNLEATDVARRERAVQRIDTMRADLAELEHYITHANAEALRGDLWADVLQDVEIATRRALRVATHDGRARLDRVEFAGHG